MRANKYSTGCRAVDVLFSFVFYCVMCKMCKKDVLLLSWATILGHLFKIVDQSDC